MEPKTMANFTISLKIQSTQKPQIRRPRIIASGGALASLALIGERRATA